MAGGIRDKVAILGMGCSRFGERWDAAGADLANFHPAFARSYYAGIEDR